MRAIPSGQAPGLSLQGPALVGGPSAALRGPTPRSVALSGLFLWYGRAGAGPRPRLFRSSAPAAAGARLLRPRRPTGPAALTSGSLRCAAGPSSRSARPPSPRCPGPPPWSRPPSGGLVVVTHSGRAGPRSPRCRSAGPPRGARRGSSGPGALGLAALGRRRRRRPDGRL